MSSVSQRTALCAIALICGGCCTTYDCTIWQYGEVINGGQEYCAGDEDEAKEDCKDEQNGDEYCGIQGGCDVSCSCSEPD